MFLGVVCPSAGVIFKSETKMCSKTWVIFVFTYFAILDIPNFMIKTFEVSYVQTSNY